jgi:hypothetical protein
MNTMTKEINLEIIKESGYATWCDFLTRIKAYTATKEINYSYIDSHQNEKSIILDIGPSLLDQMALEEAKIILPMLKMNSFTELIQRIDNEKKHFENDTYNVDIIVRNLMDQIVLKKVTLKIELIRRLASIEVRKHTFLVYHEELKRKLL